MVAVLLAMPWPSMVAITLASPWDRKKTAEGVFTDGINTGGRATVSGG